MNRLLCLLVCLFLINGQMASAIKLIPWKKSSDECATFLLPEPRDPKLTSDEALLALMHDSPELVKRMGREDNPPPWSKLLNDYLLPARRSHSNDLAIAFYGPGNSGKSTILNSLATQTAVSKIDFSEGTTSRLVFLVNSKLAQGPMLSQRFGRNLVPWQSSNMATQSGPPVVFRVQNFYKHLIMIDVPSNDIVRHHDTAALAVRWADVIAYVFTYTNYRNELNLRNLRDTFQKVGNKPVIMIYRAPSSMPKRDAFAHMQELASLMFPNATINPNTGFPTFVIGSYVLLESDRVPGGRAKPVILPFRKTTPLPALLDTLDLQHAKFRRLSLQNNFNFLLDGMANDIRQLQRNEAEVKLTDEAFRVLLQETIDQSIRNFPYDRIAQDLHEIWAGRRLGFHAAARFIAHPIRSLGGHKTALTINDYDRNRLESFLNSSVDHIISTMLLAASRYFMTLSGNDPDVKKIIATVSALHEKYGIPENEPPYIVKKDNTVELHLSDTPEIKKRLENFLNRDWDQTSREIKSSTLDSVLRLVYVIQAELDTAVGRTSLRYKSVSLLHSSTAVAPAVILTMYMFLSGAANVKTVMGLLAASGWARFWVFLDERKLDKEWLDKICKWFHDRQMPFFVDIFNRYAKFDTEPNTIPVLTEFGQLRAATRMLRENPPAFY